VPDGRSPTEPEGPEEEAPAAPRMLPMVNPASLGAGHDAVIVRPEPPPEPRDVPRGVVVFDMDGTLLDDMPLIAEVAGEVLHAAFGTPREEGRVHYYATTGMPFEAQLAQLYPDAPAELRGEVARRFHERKPREAYAYAHLFPEVPRLLKRLDREGWTLVVSTGAEREVAELLLEREGIRIWFESVLGSAQGTKREHLDEYRRRYPRAPLFLVGDSRFDLEAAIDRGVPMLARSQSHPEWTLTPEDLRRWGAAWAAPSLGELPEALAAIERESARRPGASPGGARARRAKKK
jgi:phosphoglycolate phosphatase-like HAD superfamily hydrolase